MITLARIGRIIWIIQIIKSAMNMTSDMAYTELFRLCRARVIRKSAKVEYLRRFLAFKWPFDNNLITAAFVPLFLQSGGLRVAE